MTVVALLVSGFVVGGLVLTVVAACGLQKRGELRMALMADARRRHPAGRGRAS